MEARQEVGPLGVLVQVLADDSEGTKKGVNPEEAMELVRHIKDECPQLAFKGLMSMGKLGDEKEFATIY